MRARLSSWVLGLAACAAVPGWAQQMILEPTPAAACLTTGDKEDAGPEYPFPQYKEGRPGRVLVELSFSGPDRAPGVKLLQLTGDDDFVTAVERHARKLRVPCLAAGQSARLQQEYVFKTDDRQVYGAAPVDAAAARRRELASCVVHVSGEQSATYPVEALRANVQGRVLAALRFRSASEAPEVELFHRPAARMLRRTVQGWSSGLRMPCFDGEEFSYTAVFQFNFVGEAAGFKALDLKSLLPGIEGICESGLVLDTTRMGCPFQVKLMYRQPHMPNVVTSVGDADPARWPLLKWLQGIKLALPDRALDTVFGDTADITVPCLKIDLKPKEKSS
jgi:hypothetical protein